VSTRNDAPAQLYVLPLAGGEAEPVTALPIAVSSPRWFPDGRRIAFLASTWPDLNDDFDAVRERLDEEKERKVTVHTSENRLVRYWDHYLTDGRLPHLFVVDLETRRVTDLVPGSGRRMALRGAGSGWDLAPDGLEIAFSANATEPPYQKLNYDIFVVSTSGGEPRNLTNDNAAWDTSPRYSPDGRFILYGRRERPDVHPDFAHLALYDRDAERSNMLAPEWDASLSAWSWSHNDKIVFVHVHEYGRTHLYSVEVPGGKSRRLVEGATIGSTKAGGKRLVYLRESIQSPAEIWSARRDGRSAKQITDFNGERLAALDLGSVEDHRFIGADGDSVQMFVVLPPGFDPSQKWPLLHCVHGGPHGAWRDAFHYRWNAALFASRGHVATFVNFHGSTGTGQEFAESILGNHAEKPFEDIMKATDYMLSLGSIDSERMAAAGGSYGGYMVSWILGHTNRFAALINHAGVYDLMAQFASDYTWGRPNNYGATPWEDPDRIDLYSPNRYAERFATPTLILHGEKDYRVPYTQGLELHGVLTAKGVPSRIVLFPDENHWILKPHSSRVWWGEVFDWLERYAPPNADAVSRG
jgi:dipeptidyl aminopeptidase/acylaminoacyl peptidase